MASTLVAKSAGTERWHLESYQTWCTSHQRQPSNPKQPPTWYESQAARSPPGSSWHLARWLAQLSAARLSM
jgi:hypothetical protein